MHHPGKRALRHVLTTLIILITLPAALAAEKPALSLEDTVSLKSASGAVMSPNGDAVAYLLSVPRTLYVDADGPAWKQLHVVNTDGESRPYFSGQVSVSQVAWSPDGNELFFIAKRDVKADFADIWRMPLHGGEAEVVYKASAGIKSIHPSPDGRTIAFLASDPKPADDKTLKEKRIQGAGLRGVQPVRARLDAGRRVR